MQSLISFYDSYNKNKGWPIDYSSELLFGLLKVHTAFSILEKQQGGRRTSHLGVSSCSLSSQLFIRCKDVQALFSASSHFSTPKSSWSSQHVCRSWNVDIDCTATSHLKMPFWALRIRISILIAWGWLVIWPCTEKKENIWALISLLASGIRLHSICLGSQTSETSRTSRKTNVDASRKGCYTGN